MPRDATETKARLAREAERLFATRGVYQVTVREIVNAAGQRNVSALTYHFGSREGLLEAILIQHGDPTDVARGEHLAASGGTPARGTSSTRSSCRMPRTWRRPKGATTCVSSPNSRHYSALGVRPTRAPVRTCSRSSASSSSGPSTSPRHSVGSVWSR